MSPAGADRFRDPSCRRLLDAARRSLERTGGDLGRTVTVRAPSDAERRAIVGIIGTHRQPGRREIKVGLRSLDDAVRRATGHSLAGLLTEIGPPLRDRPAEHAATINSRAAAMAAAASSPLYESTEWYRTWLAEIRRDGTVGRLLSRYEGGSLATAGRVLELIEARAAKDTPITLPALAASATSDTKALNNGTTLSTLVLRALALRAGTARPTTAEERRDLWERFGVVPDDLASRVLVLNLPAAGEGLGEWLTGAARYGTPFYVTLHQLTSMPVTVASPRVYACENPAVLRRAAAELGSSAWPLLCAEGRPSAAFHRLAAAVTAGGGRLRYHGDFDWAGVAIAADVIDRHGAAPWRMSAADYLDAATTEGEHAALTGREAPTPWDPTLAEAMTEWERAVYEETVADPLMADLAG
ncbi:TIGR02679 family protein [Halostreptopolyspora alba]|uniref:TIGR02679 family protein n=1 Tax=Halostreptopolyspora alba TaxID=2487137 RepID=A0A3N0EI81_9ACTN|nr:TIGR02679 family protein [Nocardiopsaceae bacterium YIM 96095]